MNCEVEYDLSNEVVSHAWLQLVASKGVLLHLETNMSVQRVSESGITCLSHPRSEHSIFRF